MVINTVDAMKIRVLECPSGYSLHAPPSSPVPTSEACVYMHAMASKGVASL